MLFSIKRLLAVGSVAFLAACGGGGDDRNVVEQAQTDPRFSILVEAVSAAGLAPTLSGAGPFTVFAPTNDAFASLLAELGATKEQLLADTGLLTTVLTYHVVAGKVTSDQVPLDTPITTVQTGTFTVSRAGGNLQITDARGRTARIVQADIPATNGVLHAIDRVILPSP